MRGGKPGRGGHGGRGGRGRGPSSFGGHDRSAGPARGGARGARSGKKRPRDADTAARYAKVDARPRPDDGGGDDDDEDGDDNDGGASDGGSDGAGENVIASFEKARRATRPEWRHDEASRLPVKLADGTFRAPEKRPAAARNAMTDLYDDDDEEEDEDDDDENDDDEEDDEEDDDEAGDGGDAAAARKRKRRPRAPSGPSGPTTFAELSRLPPAAVSARRAGLKAQIAEFAEAIIADPEHNISAPAGEGAAAAAAAAGAAGAGSGGGKDKASSGRTSSKRNTLLALHRLCSDPDPVVRRLALLSLTAVLKDIIPGYRIRPPSDGELATKQKKDVKKLRDFESALLRGHQRFLQLLEHTAKSGERASRAIRSGKEAGWARSHGVADSAADSADPAAAAAAASASSSSGSGAGFLDDSRVDFDAPDAATAGGPRKKVKTSDYARQKMQERKAAAAAAAGLVEYDADAATVRALGLTAIQCLGTLLAGAPHFNFRTNIIDFLVPRTGSKDEEFSRACCDAVGALFAADVSFEASLEAARALSRASADSVGGGGGGRGGGSSSLTLTSGALLTLLRLPLGILERIDSHASTRKDRDALRAAKRNKSAEDRAAVADIEAGLKAADAEAVDDRRKHAKAALKAVIAVYFRVLRSPSHAHLLPDVLQGLAKFAHLVDVGIISDLLAALRALLGAGAAAEDDDADLDDAAGAAGASDPSASASSSSSSSRGLRLSVPAALNCVLTALRIMAGPGQVLNADETEFAHFLYGVLTRIPTTPGAHQHALLACFAVQALLINRREYSTERVAAFARRLLTLSLHLPVNGCLATLSMARTLANKYPAIGSLFTAPTGGAAAAAAAVGSAAAAARDLSLATAAGSKTAVFDPDHAGALASTAWELAALQNHYHPAVRAAATAAAAGAPLLPSDQPAAVWAAFDESTGLFTGTVAAPRPHPLAAKVAAAAAPPAADGAQGAEEGAAAAAAAAGKGRRRRARNHRSVHGQIFFIRPSRPAEGWVREAGKALDGLAVRTTEAVAAGAAGLFDMKGEEAEMMAGRIAEHVASHRGKR
jgi:hypothetical protein